MRNSCSAPSFLLFRFQIKNGAWICSSAPLEKFPGASQSVSRLERKNRRFSAPPADAITFVNSCKTLIRRTCGFPDFIPRFMKGVCRKNHCSGGTGSARSGFLRSEASLVNGKRLKRPRVIFFKEHSGENSRTMQLSFFRTFRVFREKRGSGFRERSAFRGGLRLSRKTDVLLLQ